MGSMDRRWSALVLVAACVAACRQPNSPPPGETTGISPGADKCADYNGGLFSNVSGTLRGERDRARRVSERLFPRDALGEDHTEKDGSVVRLTPICANHRLAEKQLKKGRFVAVLTGRGTKPRFSQLENDVVFWWVYGEDLKTSDGRDTTVWHSEFLSLRSGAANPYLVNTELHTCPTEARDSSSAEAIDWHSGTCHLAMAGGIRPGGDRPWFGCTRGCCYAAMPTLSLDTGNLVRDTVPPDTLPRDTTR